MSPPIPTITDPPIPIGLRYWLQWQTIKLAVSGFLALVYPHSVASPAYGWALKVFAGSTEVLGVCFFIVALAIVYGLVRDNYTAVVSALGLSLWVDALFALSILAITLDGGVRGALGVIAWASSAAMSGIFLYSLTKKVSAE